MKHAYSLVKLVFILIAGVFLLSAATPAVSALTESDLKAIRDGYPGYDPTEGGGCAPTTGAPFVPTGDNPKIVFDYFVWRGLTPEQSAGIVGNFMQESYTKIDPTLVDGPAKGIAQWEGQRRINLDNFAAKKGKPWDNLMLQLDFVWEEFNTYESGAFQHLKSTQTVEEAARSVSDKYERPGIPEIENRIRYAQETFARYGGGTAGGGLNTGGAGTSSPCFGGGTVGNIPTGSTQELAHQILDSDRIKFQVEPSQRRLFEPVAQTGRQTGPCSTVPIDARLLGILLAVSQKYKQIVVGVFNAGHECTGGQHQKGKAVDLNGVTPINGSGTGNYIRPGSKNSQRIENPVIKGQWGDWDNPLLKAYYEDLARLLSVSGGGGIGQINCFPPGNAPQEFPKVDYFWDTCHHIHLDTRGT